MKTQLPHAEKTFDKAQLSKAALQAFFSISSKWKLKPEQQMCLLGGVPRSTFYAWKDKLQSGLAFEIPKDTLERVSYLLGIYKNLHILLPNERAANEWIHKSNQAPLFNGATALQKMLAGHVVDLADIRRYLDSARGS